MKTSLCLALLQLLVCLANCIKLIRTDHLINLNQLGVRNSYVMTIERGTNFGRTNFGKIVLTNFGRWTNFTNILLKGKDGRAHGIG